MGSSLNLVNKKIQTMDNEELKLLCGEILKIIQPELKTYWILKTDFGYLRYDVNIDYGVITGNMNLATEFAESVNLHVLKMAAESYVKYVLKYKTIEWIPIKKIQT